MSQMLQVVHGFMYFRKKYLNVRLINIPKIKIQNGQKSLEV